MLVEQDTYDKWSEFVDENPNYRQISHLVRGAVGREIRGEYGGSSGNGGSSEQTEKRLSEIEGAIISLEETTSEMARQIDTIHDSVREPSADVVELSGDIYDVLPEEHELSDTAYDLTEGEHVENAVDSRTNGSEYVQTGRVNHIADYLGEDTYRVREGIEQLQDDTSLVSKVMMEGETRFYKQ